MDYMKKTESEYIQNNDGGVESVSALIRSRKGAYVKTGLIDRMPK